MKLVINKCFGGYGLSDPAIKLYAKLKGITLFPEQNKFSKLIGPTYWIVSEDKRPKSIEKDWMNHSVEERIAYNKALAELTLTASKIERNDKFLVQVVEKLGNKANGYFAELKVIEIPDGIEYEIKEYDGMESVHELHRSWT